ncbi:MAG TPA: hypothetical protein VFD39_11875, partial [Trueperaceae bacterium]|nr:hypothetical protein [Trueperaceae bacterium]
MTELSTHVFELDLTSVCVSTGVVQLPMKMQPFFADGAIHAKLDGEAVPLEFSGPRRLGGFKSHFEKRALKANDRVRFELVVDDGAIAELAASCIKRERNKPVTTKPVTNVDVSGSVAPRTGDQGESQRSEASEVEETTGWDRGGTARALRRVTIQGSDSVPSIADVPSMGRDAADWRDAAAAQAKGRLNGSTRWQPLDGVSPAVSPNADSEAEFIDTTVRAIR